MTDIKTICLALLLAALACLLLACGGSPSTPNPPPPESSLVYQNGGVLMSPGGEGSIVEFKGRLLVVMGQRVQVSTPRIQIVDLTGSVVADFETSITLICAYVEGERLYIFGVTDFNMGQGLSAKGNRVVRMSTDDLAIWESQTVYTFPSNISAYNLSVTPTPSGYIMGYDFGGPEYSPTWQIGFLESPDLLNWSPIAGHFEAYPFSSANAVRYLNNYYYLFYSTQDSAQNYYTAVVRSVDLLNWETTSIAAIYPTEGYQHINTTDFDLVESNGVVYVNFAVGDQSGNGAMATAVYSGSLQQMVSKLF